MINMQTIIPIPFYTSHTHHGPWTNGDTQFIVVLTLTLFVAWAATLLVNWLYYRAKGQPEKLIRLMEPLEGHAWVLTDFLGLLFYCLLGLDILGGLGYLIYQIIF